MYRLLKPQQQILKFLFFIYMKIETFSNLKSKNTFTKNIY